MSWISGIISLKEKSINVDLFSMNFSLFCFTRPNLEFGDLSCARQFASDMWSVWTLAEVQRCVFRVGDLWGLWQLEGCPFTGRCISRRLSVLGKQPLALSWTGSAGKWVNTSPQSDRPGRTQSAFALTNRKPSWRGIDVDSRLFPHDPACCIPTSRLLSHPPPSPQVNVPKWQCNTLMKLSRKQLYKHSICSLPADYRYCHCCLITFKKQLK